jgi:hypothetical protein
LEHIREYFARREAEMAELSVAPDTEVPFASRDDHHGRMFTRLGLSERSFLAVNERVVIADGVKHRISYAYYLITDEAEVRAYERDPSHSPAEHRHDADHKTFPCEPVSFQWAVEHAWETFQSAEDLADG